MLKAGRSAVVAGTKSSEMEKFVDNELSALFTAEEEVEIREAIKRFEKKIEAETKAW